MDQTTLQHADTFFFITSIAVVICIVILLVILYTAYRIYAFSRKTMIRVDTLLDKAGDHVNDNPIYKKSLPYVLPIFGYLFSKKHQKTRHKNTDM